MRTEFPAKVKMQAYQRCLTCATCGKVFSRPQMYAKRAAKPQLCSKECLKKHHAKLANERRDARFWKKVDKTSSPTLCWVWTAYTDSAGYGKFQFADKKPMPAHRYSYELTYGRIRHRDMYVCHKCDNPGCVRPDHLFLGTAADNMADCSAKGRISRRHQIRGVDHPASKLTEEEVIEIYSSIKTQAFLARKFNVTIATISQIKRQRTWKWLTEKFNAY